MFVQDKPFLGAQVVQLPCFHALRARHPGARLIAVTPPGGARFLHELGAVDDVIPAPGLAAWPAAVARLRALRPARVYHQRRHSLRAGLLAWAASGGRVVGFRGNLGGRLQEHTVPYDRNRYMALNYLALLDLDLAPFRAAHPRRSLGHALLIPVGSEARKLYPLPSYLEVGRALAREGLVRVLLGPGMETEAALVARKAPDFRVHVGRPLAEVRDLVRGARVVVANDCGPSHFAHVHGVPRVALFDRGTNAREWFLPEGNARLLRSAHPGGLAALDPREVAEAALAVMDRGEAPGGTLPPGERDAPPSAWHA